MNEAPLWLVNTWLFFSLLFFIANLVLMVVLIRLALFMMQKINELQPKVDAITAKVHSISERVEEIAISTRATMDSLGGHAKSTLTSIDSIAHVASRQFERFSPFIIGATTAIRLVKALYDVKKGKHPAEATTQKAIEAPAKKGKKRRIRWRWNKLFGT